MSNTRAAIAEFRPLAAVWERATGSIDLKRTIREGGHVLILQPSEEHFSAARAANRLILTLILQFALDFPDSDDFRLFCLLDEVQELGRIEILPRATSVIRSKGGCLFYYTQLLDLFIKEYGEHDTSKILDNIPTKAVFAVHGRMARWASEQFGQIEIERYVETKAPEDDTPKSMTQQFQRTDAVFAGEVSGIAPPSPERGLSGLYRTRLTRPVLQHHHELRPPHAEAASGRGRVRPAAGRGRMHGQVGRVGSPEARPQARPGRRRGGDPWDRGRGGKGH